MSDDVIIHCRGGHHVTYEDDLVPRGIQAGSKRKSDPAIARGGRGHAYGLNDAVIDTLAKTPIVPVGGRGTLVSGGIKGRIVSQSLRGCDLEDLRAK